MRSVTINFAGFEYELFENGDMFSTRFGRKRKKASTSSSGYKHYGFYDPMDRRIRFYNVHKLVATHFVENPCPDRFTDAHHIDHDKTNNDASNLMWVNRRLNKLADPSRNAYFYRKVRKWQARVAQISLGLYDTQTEARNIARNFKRTLFYATYNEYTGSDPTQAIFDTNPRDQPRLFDDVHIETYLERVREEEGRPDNGVHTEFLPPCA